MALAWQAGDMYYVRTSCDRYHVSKSYVDNVAQYIAWHRDGTATSFREIGTRNSAADAKALCEQRESNLNKSRGAA